MEPTSERENLCFTENETVLGELGMWLYEFAMECIDVAYNERSPDEVLICFHDNSLQMLLVAIYEMTQGTETSPQIKEAILKGDLGVLVGSRATLPKIESFIQLGNDDTSASKLTTYSADVLISQALGIYEIAQDCALAEQDSEALKMTVRHLKNGTIKGLLHNIQLLLKMKDTFYQ